MHTLALTDKLTCNLSKQMHTGLVNKAHTYTVLYITSVHLRLPLESISGCMNVCTFVRWRVFAHVNHLRSHNTHCYRLTSHAALR